ncbi:MAG: flagellar basal body protein [Caulobacteraceae bacterium]
MSAERVTQLIELTERLTALIAAEALAFEQHRPQDAAANIAETSRLANMYRHESAKVRQDPRLIEGAPRDQRLKLIQATEAFDAVLARQGRALHAAKTVTEGLVQAIAQEVAATRSSGTGYGPGASAAQGDARAITLNRQA